MRNNKINAIPHFHIRLIIKFRLLDSRTQKILEVNLHMVTNIKQIK